MKFKLDRIISIATLVSSVVAIVLVLQKPAPVAHPQAPAAIAANAESFDQKLAQLEQASQHSQAVAAGTAQPSPPQQAVVGAPSPKAEVHINSDEIAAVLAQALGAASGGTAGGASAGATGGSPGLSADPNIGSGAPAIKDQNISFEGDVVHGQFLTEIAGKDVWITVSGHLGEKDGYATFDPTEFKVGDLNVPVSLVNSALQRKLSEQRDRLKLPDYIGDVRVQNGELVMEQK
jgi:hypothetical protein